MRLVPGFSNQVATHQATVVPLLVNCWSTQSKWKSDVPVWHDLADLLSTHQDGQWTRAKLNDNLKWARMKVKPSKSRSVSINKKTGGKGVLDWWWGDSSHCRKTLSRVSAGGTIPHSVTKDRFQSLENSLLSLSSTIDATFLPGKLKWWCLLLGRLPYVRWPLTVYEVTISKI